MKKLLLSFTAYLLTATTANAQLSTNPDKFLGNITTSGQVDFGNEKFYTLWNQITPENESKWASVEGNRGSYNWGGCDNCVNYAKNHHFPFKYHTLVWGSQFPGWLSSLSANDRYDAIVKWFDAVKKKYPNLEMIDVVNEAVEGHQKDTPLIKEALGGGGKTGYDWLIKAFEMAYERWPNAILIYNDFNTFQWNTDQYIDLVRTIRDAGAPVDAYGCQSHDLTGCSLNTLKASEQKIQNALKMPMFISEYDIGTDDDNLQKTNYSEQIPYLWEKSYCAGITLWGYIYGRTWTTNGNSGIIKNGADRPAMTWLRSYMKSDAAKNAKSPYPGMKKEASLYIKPASTKVAKNDTIDVTVRVALATKTVAKVDFYVGSTLEATMTEAPYVAQFSSKTAGTKTLKAVLTTTDGSTYERLAQVTVLDGTRKRAPFNGAPIQLPGVIEAEDFDQGLDGVAFHDSDATNSGVKTYRSGGGVDIVKAGEGLAIGTTKAGEWLDYTVDVQEDGLYSFDAIVSAAKAGGVFHIVENAMTGMTFVTDYIEVPQTGSANDYQQMHIRLTTPLKAGRQVLTLFIDNGGFNIDRMSFTPLDTNNSIKVSVKVAPTKVVAGDSTTITATASLASGTIDHVSLYANGLLLGTLTEAPYILGYRPATKGTCSITAIATDATGKESKVATATLKVNGQRAPYKGVISLPGIIQAENFDQGGEGLSFHDTDATDEGDANYRNDNEGLDLVKGNSGTAIGYTAKGEWTEYTVNVKEQGEYSFEATCSNGSSSNGGFSISLINGSTVTQLAKVTVKATGGWDTYKVFTGKLSKHLAKGEQILRFTITDANCNIDKVQLKCTLNTSVESPSADDAFGNGTLYNLQGVPVDKRYKGVVIKNGRKVINKEL